MPHARLLEFLRCQNLLPADCSNISTKNISSGLLSELDRLGILREEHAIKLLCSTFGLQYFPQLSQFGDIETLLERIDPDLCFSKLFVPIAESAEKITAVFADPLDSQALGAAQFALEKPVEIAVSRAEEIKRVLDCLCEPKPLKDQSLTSKIQKDTVLVVDDDPDILDLMTFLLENERFEVLQANGGAKGLEIAYRNQPDLVLLDLAMPEVDGTQFLRQMQTKNMQSIPVVVFSAQDMEERELEALNLGARDFVSKTAAPGVLIARLRKTLLHCKNSSGLEVLAK